MKKIAVFVDVQNIYYTTRQAYGRSFNYRKFWQLLQTQGEICYAFAYAIDKKDDQQIKFQDALRHIGFEVKLKPFIQRADGSAKGDWDVGITIDMLTLAAEVDTVVLLSGDGDFDLLLQAVYQQHGVDTVVYSVPGLTAQSLQQSCACWRPIEADLLL
ncbi:NYN domain-containing protein [Rheinheimera mesophila]|uniref:NYN domain-containing protein n=2 Tax=Rheinheimera mesophila TaxID=1547515 RepID=A0A3P3QBA9_9GAMM|nr:nuclease [Rheinheimera mesophila]RRJ18502.1 NYN domain-containing protein [Rheinheimera mesophila]